MRLFFSLIISVIISFGCAYASRWKMHPTFDGEIVNLVETPGYVYFTSRAVPSSPMFENVRSLFRYDKESEEMQSLSTDNLLSCNTVSEISYCPSKGYVAVVSTNHDIDLIYDNGEVVNIPGYRLASISFPKKVNSISFSSSNDRIYLATDFGYVSVNDKKHEIAESRIFETPISSVARVGKWLLMLHDNELLYCDASSSHFSLSDFHTEGSYDSPVALYPLGDQKALMLTSGESSNSIRIINADANGISVGDPINGKFSNIENNREGVTVASDGKLYQFLPDGSYSTINIPGDGPALKSSSYRLSELWQGVARKGIRSSDIKPDGLVTTRSYMAPDAPSPYVSTEMKIHPELGLLVQNFGFDYNLQNIPPGDFLLSGYLDGDWTNYSPAYMNPVQTGVIRRSNGFAIDPDNPDYIYVSSTENGFARLNLRDGNDILHVSKRSDPMSGLPGFVPLFYDQKGDNAWSCRLSAPRFDKSGNMWMLYSDFDNQNPERLHLLYWKSDDRKNTVSASDFRSPRFIEIEGVRPTNTDMLLPLQHSSNDNLLVYSTGHYDNKFVVMDTGGNPDRLSEGMVKIVNNVYDQDGNNVEVHNVRTLWEEPSTGNVWVGHSGGAFYFNPKDFINGSERVTRIKVARNDGTNLADYLLNEVPVNKICSDASGRKWFSTGGAGLVCLSSDNRVIEEELTATKSDIPDDIVYCAEYIPASNSLMVSTGGGLAEYFLKSSSVSGGSSENNIRAYPNPVRPEYGGYVTIDGFPARALVKITNSSGALVKELTSEGSGEVKWDVTDTHFRKVGSGVYFILVTGLDDDEPYSGVGKVLVIN